MPPLLCAATPAEIDAAIGKGVKAIYAHQKEDGSWEAQPRRDPKALMSAEAGGQWGVRTALATHALLAAGEDSHAPALARAIEWLKQADVIGTYARSMRCQVWLAMPETPEVRKLVQDDTDAIGKAFNTSGKAQSLYAPITNKRMPTLIDHRASHFGVLAMSALEEVKPEATATSYWAKVEARWAADQQADGGWFFAGAPFKSGPHSHEETSITAFGVSVLFTTQEYAHPEYAARCVGNVTSPAIDRGIAYLGAHRNDWELDEAPDDEHPTGTPFYTLYSVQRIGAASGLKYIGDVDWYEHGSEWCVRHQLPNGTWRTAADTSNTALVLLFLTRGRAPILINKVQYTDADGPDVGKLGHWNERPRDVANLVNWAGRQDERDLNWQITNLKVSEGDLQDAPFLYFSGNQALRLATDEKRKLREFCGRGGMVLFNADGGDASTQAAHPLVASVVALARELYPSYEFRDLPTGSPIYSEQFPLSRWKKPPTIRSLGNGVRELWFLLPDDPAKAWQLHQTVGAGKEEAFQSLQDIILYGTDKQPLRVKGIPFLVDPDPKVTATRTIKVGRAKYAGNWDPEPGGWQRLAAILHNRARVDLDVKTIELGKGQLREAGVKVVHLTGTTPLKLTSAQQSELKVFVASGGTLIVEAAGGVQAFAQSAETMLNTMYPKGLDAPLPPTDFIYKRFDPTLTVRYRPYTHLALGRQNAPDIKAITLDGRPAVFYSRHDLSSGLVGASIDGIVGYDPDSATAIMAGVLLGAGQ